MRTKVSAKNGREDSSQVKHKLTLDLATKMRIGDGAELCDSEVVRDLDAEGGAVNNPEAGKVTKPAGRSSPTPRLDFHL